MGRRRRKRRRFILFLLIIAIGAFLIVKYNKVDMVSKYSKEALEVIKEKGIKIKKNVYSKTLDELLKHNKYNLEYVEEYLNITYVEADNFLDNINKYLKKGYKAKDINNIYKLSKKNQEKLLEMDKVDFDKYVKIKNFDVEKIDRYNKYKSDNKEIDIKDVVTYVNINLDIPYYSEAEEVSDPDNLLVLVNKYNHLPKNYKPEDLVYAPGAYGNKVPFRKVIRDDFEELQKKAKEDINIELMPTTAFRDESFQTTLYNNYVASDGKEKADTYSARPGYSEHQTGLAIDLKNMALSNTRLTDDDYKWLEDNSYKYGFIIRFPKDKENITGYQFENWHIRYVGKDNAKIIHDNNLTLEEYIDLYVKEY